MKTLSLIVVLFMLSSTLCVTERMRAELKEVHSVLGEALKTVLNKTNVEFQHVLEFVEKHTYLHDIFKKFASNKKTALSKMSSAFTEGFLMSESVKLYNEEMNASDAYINNPVFWKNYTKYQKEFPYPQCYSTVYTFTLANASAQMTKEDFDPMTLFYALSNINGSTFGDLKSKRNQINVNLE